MTEDITVLYHEMRQNIEIIEDNNDDHNALQRVSALFEKIFEYVKILLISKKERYYGYFLMDMNLVIDYYATYEASVNIDTFPFSLRVNPLLLGKCSLKEMIFIICHEVEHIVLDHPSEGNRINADNDPIRHMFLNFAMDASVNDRLIMEIEKYDLQILRMPDDGISSQTLSRDYHVQLSRLKDFLYYYRLLPQDSFRDAISSFDVMEDMELIDCETGITMSATDVSNENSEKENSKGTHSNDQNQERNSEAQKDSNKFQAKTGDDQNGGSTAKNAEDGDQETGENHNEDGSIQNNSNEAQNAGDGAKIKDCGKQNEYSDIWDNGNKAQNENNANQNKDGESLSDGSRNESDDVQDDDENGDQEKDVASKDKVDDDKDRDSDFQNNVDVNQNGSNHIQNEKDKNDSKSSDAQDDDDDTGDGRDGQDDDDDDDEVQVKGVGDQTENNDVCADKVKTEGNGKNLASGKGDKCCSPNVSNQIVKLTTRSGKVFYILPPQKQGIVTAKNRGPGFVFPIWTELDVPEDIRARIQEFAREVYDSMTEESRGLFPAHQQEALKKLLAPPQIPWETILRKYIGVIPHAVRKTKTRLDRRQPERYDISGRISNRTIRLVVAVDTSGSMDEKQLESVFSEIFSILKNMKYEMTIIECDAEIQNVYEAKSMTDVNLNIKGRGGTSFVPVIEYLNSHRRFRESVLLYFTDGFGEIEIPKPRVYRTLWITTSDERALSVEKPYGEVIGMRLPEQMEYIEELIRLRLLKV